MAKKTNRYYASTYMEARCYNQTIGRLLGNDVYSSASPRWTGYRLGWNQPQNVNDPTGNYEYTDGYGTWDIESVASSTVVCGNLERAPGQSGDEAEREIQYDDSGKAVGVRIGYGTSGGSGGLRDPILPGHHLFGLIDSRQDDIGNWHYYKAGTNEEIIPSASGWDYIVNQANAFLPNALGAITK